LFIYRQNFQEEENAEAVGMDEDGGEDMLDLESLNYDDLDSVSKLQKTQCYNDIMQVHDQTHKSSLCFI
jgi:U4/U6 small nuclear ribonucleoprotein PRP31